MAASSLSSLSFFSLSHSKTPTFPQTLNSSSLISSPKPRSKRKNRLRPKLPPKPQNPKPILENPSPILPNEAEESASEAVELVQELIFESQTLDPLPNPSPSPSPKSIVIDLSLRFAALIFVQTVVAVWIFGGRSGGEKPEEEIGVSVVENEAREEDKVKESLDFERAVLEIREMAKEAREREVKEMKENELEREKLFLKADPGRQKLGSRKSLGFLRSNVRRRNAGKGFDASKKIEGSNADDTSDIQQITHQFPTREFADLQKPRQSTEVLNELTKKSGDVEEASVLPSETSSYVGDLNTFQISIERSGSGHQASPVDHSSTQGDIQIKEGFNKGVSPSSTKSSNVNGRAKSRRKKRESVGKLHVTKHKDGSFYPRKRPWWLKLPFVLAILLRRGSDGNSPKGLYSLDMDFRSDDGGSTSYTIVFQDQGDATNFCYLLESFFEELDGFSADVVPLSISESQIARYHRKIYKMRWKNQRRNMCIYRIVGGNTLARNFLYLLFNEWREIYVRYYFFSYKELEEGVKSSALKVIVVRKGQLKLYAGQPLAEVEKVLRSLLD